MSAVVRRLSEEERWERLFDPPCLGAPALGAGNGGRARVASVSGRFVEIFVRVKADRVQEAGFLTNIPVLGLLFGSLWCERAQREGCEAAARLGPGFFLELLGEYTVQGLETALLCVQAGRAALRAAALCSG